MRRRNARTVFILPLCLLILFAAQSAQAATPEERLTAYANFYGDRAGLEEFTGMDLGDKITDDEAAMIVEHFTNGDLLMPWEMTSWWQSGDLPDPPLFWWWKRFEDWSRQGRIDPEDFRQPWRFGCQEGDDETLDKLASIGNLIASQPWGNKYRDYFLSPFNLWFMCKKPLLYGVIDVEELNWGFLFGIVASLMQLEDYCGSSDCPDPDSASFEEVYDIFAEFEEPGTLDKYVDGYKMRLIWQRRLAVSLWSDANGHWPWTIASMDLNSRKALLGWNPKFMEGNYNPQKCTPWTPGDSCLRYDSLNGGQIFLQNDEYTGFKDGYHTGKTWDSNPFDAWTYAYFYIRPLLSDIAQQGRKAGVYAATRWLHRRGFHHSDGNPNVNLGTYPGTANDRSSFRDVMEANFSGCQWTAPVFIGLLRTMNIYANMTRTGLPK